MVSTIASDAQVYQWGRAARPAIGIAAILKTTAHINHGHYSPIEDELGDRTAGREAGRLQEILQRTNSYERLGLYLNRPQYGHENLADVSVLWPSQVDGPKTSAMMSLSS